MTEDSRGRGLYTTQEIRTRQLFLVSNAVAVAYESASPAMFHVDNRRKVNTAYQEDLVSAVVYAAMKSQRLLRQLYSLFDSFTPSSLHVPTIDLFKVYDQEVENEILVVDVNCIRDIVRLNSFSEGVGTFVSKLKTKEAGRGLRERESSGLWLLSSLINHSCFTNSSWLLVGNAMLIHTSKPMGRGEEIIVPYFDALVPLLQRQAQCKNWGFKCKCRRCILEHSFKKSLTPIIIVRFEQWNEKAKELIVKRSQQQQPDMNLWEHAEFARLFQEAEEIISSSHLLKTEEEKLRIHASFSSVYLLSTMLNGFFPCGEKLMEAIQSTVPGDF